MNLPVRSCYVCVSHTTSIAQYTVYVNRRSDIPNKGGREGGREREHADLPSHLSERHPTPKPQIPLSKREMNFRASRPGSVYVLLIRRQSCVVRRTLSVESSRFLLALLCDPHRNFPRFSQLLHRFCVECPNFPRNCSTRYDAN